MSAPLTPRGAPRAKKWRWVWVKIHDGNSPKSRPRFMERVRGYTAPHIAGLAITPGFGIYAGQYVITHRLSGMKLPRVSYASRRGACAAAASFAKMGNWNRPFHFVERDARLRRKVLAFVAISLLPGEET